MKVAQIDCNTGIFSGTYSSAVGEAEKEYFLIGRFDTAGRTLGWVVSCENRYRNAHSTTSWSGQVEYDPSIRDYAIHTNWVLTVQTSPENDWNSTNIGQDTFRRLQPNLEQTTSAKLRFQRSHPKNA